MEGMETPATNVTPDTAVDVESSQDQGNESSPADQSATNAKDPTQGEKNKIKQQIRELGDQDLDALVKIKVNGVEKKVSVREAIKISQLEQASHQKMQEAAQLKRQFQEFAKQAKENPDLFFEQFGLDADQYSEARLAKKLEQLSMTPEQKKAREMETRLARYEEMEKRQKEETVKRQAQEQETRAAQQLDREITDAFKDSGLPKDPYYVQLMAHRMLIASKRGEPVTAKEAASQVKAQFSTNVNSVLKGMDAQAILSFLGDDVRKIVREAELKRVTDKAPPTIDSATRPAEAQAQAAARKGQKPGKPLTEKEWREWLKNR